MSLANCGWVSGSFVLLLWRRKNGSHSFGRTTFLTLNHSWHNLTMWESKNSSVVMFESVVCLGSVDLRSEPGSNSTLVIVALNNKSCPNFMNDSFSECAYLYIHSRMKFSVPRSEISFIPRTKGKFASRASKDNFRGHTPKSDSDLDTWFSGHTS